ncbi:type IV pilus modification PilV family protein [Cerasicoccus fimbriatus]|uniref:type IV pilus modification PilV family protein n=1 Tax=Cerasicoccus fimbriatus TaxID=3014554 RepID=UPI0022B3842E|nr:prepilin-type N-terminal cleavage/methylation domain-containing protein [Cerasicoccus sp. TK19100]
MILHSKWRVGVTLIEVMVGMVIISLVFLSTMATLSIGFRASENARLNADAQFWLESELESIRSLDWSEIEALQSKYDLYKEEGKALSFTNSGTDPRLTSSLAIADRNGRSDQVEITLSVAWTDKKGKTHDANMVTLVTQSGVSAS